MKNKAKRVTAVLIMAALVLTVACAQGVYDDPHKWADYEDVIVRAAELAEEKADAFPDVEVTEKIRWLSWYQMDEKTPGPEVFKNRYGTPNLAKGDNVIERINVSYENRYDVLSNMVAADNSPDMFQFEDRFYPYGVFMKLFDSIDGVIDLSGSEWDATRDAIELFKWGGRNYTPITQLANSTGILFYSKKVMKQYSLDDPYDLWLKNQWTWREFEDMLEQFSDETAPNGGRYGVMGYYIDEATIASTGTPLIGIADGKLQNNMDNGNVERATTFLQTLANKNYRYPYHTINNFNLDKAALRAGRILFWNDGPWVYQETLQQQWEADNKAKMVEEDGRKFFKPDDHDEVFNDIGIVPWPRDPNASVHYQRGKQDAMMLVSGAPNLNGYKAWIQSSVIASQDKLMDDFGRGKLYRDHNWTTLQLNTLDKILEMPVVFDFKNGIGTDIADATMASNVENLTKPVIMDGESYTAMRDAERSIIEKRLVEMNESVQ